MHKTTYYWKLLFIFSSALLLFALLRGAPPHALFWHSDKIGHALSFFAVALTGRLADLALPGWVYWTSLASLGMGLEYLQGVIGPLRTASLADAGANLLGILLAFVICWALAVLRRRTDRKG